MKKKLDYIFLGIDIALIIIGLVSLIIFYTTPGTTGVPSGASVCVWVGIIGVILSTRRIKKQRNVQN